MTITRYDVPPIDVILTLGVDQETAEKIHGVLAGTLNPREVSPACDRWIRACYNEPDLDGHEVKLAACNELLETCGVEGLTIEGESYTDEGIRMCPPFSYCNMGDTYDTTLIRDHEHGQWIISSWGDVYEEYCQEHKIGDYEEFEEAPDRCPSCHAKSFTLNTFMRGDWKDGAFVETGTGYSFVCDSCNHHCCTAKDWTPSEEE